MEEDELAKHLRHSIERAYQLYHASRAVDPDEQGDLAEGFMTIDVYDHDGLWLVALYLARVIGHPGHVTLPDDPASGIAAGVLADMLEERVYIGVRPMYGAPQIDRCEVSRESLRRVLRVLRRLPDCFCRVELS